MRIKPYRFLRYGMQILSLAAFIFLVSNLAYPLDWQAQLLAWFSRLDPWALFSHFRWQHSIPPWGWLPLLTLLSALFFGRVFCGWLCPFGALLMLVDQLSRRAFKNPSLAHIRTKILHRSQPLRYFWLLFLAVIFILGANGVLFFTPFALFSHELVSLFQGSAPWVLSVIILGTIFFPGFGAVSSVPPETSCLSSDAGASSVIRLQATAFSAGNVRPTVL